MSAGSGKLQRRFHPLINGRVYSLAVSPGGRFLFVAGQFSAVGVHPRHNLAAFNLRTGRLAKKLPDLGITGTVRTVAVSATGRVYLGGTFGRVAGSRRANLAKLVLRRNRYTLNRRWVPSTNGEVRDIVLDAKAARVVVGGGFTRVDGLGGQTSIAALGPARGQVRPWPSHPRALILDLALCGNRIYAAEGGPGGTALAYGLKGHLKWYYVTDGNVQAAACVSHRPVFGMHGDYVAPHRNQKMSEHGSGKRIQRHKLFMLTRRGALERWNPDLSSTAGVLGVWSLAAGGGNLYVGGDFTGIHGRVPAALRHPASRLTGRPGDYRSRHAARPVFPLPRPGHAVHSAGGGIACDRLGGGIGVGVGGGRRGGGDRRLDGRSGPARPGPAAAALRGAAPPPANDSF